MGASSKKTKKQVKKTVSGRVEGNRKIAKGRGPAWKKALVAGRLEAQLKPTTLRVLRVKKSINQTVLAQKIGVSTASFGSIERGKRAVSKERASLIAKELGTTTGKLFGGKNEKKLLALSA